MKHCHQFTAYDGRGQEPALAKARVYLQTAFDCHSRHAWARLFPNKLPVTAVQTLNNDVLPTFGAEGATVEVVLSDNGREFCGRDDQQPYKLFLQLEGIEHRKIWFETIEEIQVALDAYLVEYNTRRPHQGRGMNGRTPLAVLRVGIRSTTEEAPATTLKTAACPPPRGRHLSGDNRH